MSALGGLEALLGGLETPTKKILTELLRAMVPFNRFGPVDTAKAENFNGFKVTSTTATSTGEFSIEHGMGRTPYVMIPIADLTSSGASIVPLTVTRPADARRVYLKTDAGSTNKVIHVYLE